jgi:galactokinase
MRPVIRVRAPGRVNLIGEHTDYAGGLVLPVAIDRYVTVVAERAPDVRLDGSPLVDAVVAELDALGRSAVGLAGRVESDVPQGAGLGSSAALEVAVAAALCEVAGFSLEPLALADACRRAEERAVGVPCGIMDQAAATLARAGHALFLDCGALEYEHIPLPEDIALIAIDSGVRRRLGESAYARRRAEVEAGHPKRLRHVESENERVLGAVEALRRGDAVELGRILLEGHRSLRDDFGVSLRELDAIVERAMSAGALGARLTGAGFGGCVLALTAAERAEAVARGVGGVRAWVVVSADGIAEASA